MSTHYERDPEYYRRHNARPEIRARRLEHARRFRVRGQVLIDQLKQWPCLDCGWLGHPAAMDFHHRDPAVKEFPLTANNHRRKDFATEWSKCDLLCVRCHRVRHAEERDANTGH